MKKIYFLLLTVLILGCETPPKKKEPKPAPVIEESIQEVIVEEKVEKIDNTLVSLKRKHYGLIFNVNNKKFSVIPEFKIVFPFLNYFSLLTHFQ